MISYISINLTAVVTSLVQTGTCSLQSIYAINGVERNQNRTSSLLTFCFKLSTAADVYLINSGKCDS